MKVVSPVTYLGKVAQHVSITHSDHSAGHVRPVPRGARLLSVPPAMLTAESQLTRPPDHLALVAASPSTVPGTLRDSSPHVMASTEPSLGSLLQPLDFGRPPALSPALPAEQPIVRSGRVRRPTGRYRPGISGVDVKGKECNSVTQEAAAHKYRAT